MGLRFGEWGGVPTFDLLKDLSSNSIAWSYPQHTLILFIVRHASCSPKPKRLCTSKYTYIDYRRDLFILVDRTT